MIRPDFAVNIGDLIWGYFGTPKQARDEFSAFTKRVDKYTPDVDMLFVAGNHDTPSEEIQRIYRELFGQKLYYNFTFGNYRFMDGDALLLDARTLFHYEAIVVTPAMATKMVGKGSQYPGCYRDAEDNFLMGDNNYKLHLPAGIAAKDFWSVTPYHPDTRSLLQSGQEVPSVNSLGDPDVNKDGSVDVYFGPKAPEGKEKNWIKTIPGEGWFVSIRLYGPLEPYFDKTWKPDDIVLVEKCRK